VSLLDNFGIGCSMHLTCSSWCLALLNVISPLGGGELAKELGPLWLGSGSGFLRLLARSPAKRAPKKRLLARSLEEPEPFLYRGAGAEKSGFSWLLTNLIQIITKLPLEPFLPNVL
jgi:hypothetical protein